VSCPRARALAEDDWHVSETDDDVMAAFGAFLNDAAGTYGYALTGVQLTRRQVQGALDFAGPGWADTPIEMITPPLDAAGRIETFHTWPQSVVLERLSDGGLVAQQIGHQWLLLVSTSGRTSSGHVSPRRVAYPLTKSATPCSATYGSCVTTSSITAAVPPNTTAG
jgi:hypothetical protein